MVIVKYMEAMIGNANFRSFLNSISGPGAMTSEAAMNSHFGMGSAALMQSMINHINSNGLASFLSAADISRSQASGLNGFQTNAADAIPNNPNTYLELDANGNQVTSSCGNTINISWGTTWGHGAGGGTLGVSSNVHLQIGANASQGMTVALPALSTTTLFSGNASVSNHVEANNTIGFMDNALGMVTSIRARLGAYQNRLEHTIRNLDVSSENLSAAESRIRDADMALEMMNFVKSNVLSQAASSMVAQANQGPQAILQLL